MRKIAILLAALIILIAANGFVYAKGDVDGIVKGDKKSSIIVQPESLEAIAYIEGLNEAGTVTGGWYGADWFGIEYTPSVSYNLKKVELIAGTGTGPFIVQLRADDGSGMPSNTVLREVSFNMVDTVSWQGAEFASSYPVNAGTLYWIVFKPVSDSQASIATSGTLITHVFDSGGDGWDAKTTTLYWMAKFYDEGTQYQYCLNDGAYDINFDISAPWLYGIEDTTLNCGYDAQTVGYVKFPHFFMYNDINSASATCNEGYFEYCDWSNYPSPGSCIWRNIPGGTGTGSLSFCSANIESSSSSNPLSR